MENFKKVIINRPSENFQNAVLIPTESVAKLIETLRDHDQTGDLEITITQATKEDLATTLGFYPLD